MQIVHPLNPPNVIDVPVDVFETVWKPLGWVAHLDPVDPGAGTVEEVLAAVKDNPVAAREVLDAERVGRRRKTLMDPLDQIANTPAGSTADTPDDSAPAGADGA